jgi:hypothetical protein
MKKSIKLKIIYLIIACITIPLALISCSTTARAVPITDSVITELGGINNTPKFQFYISKTITLGLGAGDMEPIIEEGQLIRRNAAARNFVIIQENTPGLVRSNGLRTNEARGFFLDVAFEDYEGDPIIQFGKYREGIGEKYQILYHNSANRVIDYGGVIYNVSYEGDEPPYLLIMVRESAADAKNARKASGLKLE